VERTRTAWVPFAVLAGGAVGLSAIFVAGSARLEPGWQLVVMAATFAVEALVAWVAFARFRGSRDPHALLLGAGFAVLAVQALWFGVGWPLAHGTVAWAVIAGTSLATYAPSPSANAAPYHAWQIGWVVAGGAFVLANPWWERRGNRPWSARWVMGAVLALVLLGDLAIVLGGRHRTVTFFAPLESLSRANMQLVGVRGTLGWVLGIGAAGLLIFAALREWTASASDPSRAWLSGAFLLAGALQVAVLAHPTPGTAFLQAADLLQPVVALVAFGWFLQDLGADASRSRRAEDRAEAVLAGRAEIASMIAHEVRGPVATVRGIAATSLTHHDRLTEAERREFLTMIEQESVQLLGAVDQMALGLKVDAGTLRFDLGPADLGEIVKAAAGDVEHGDRLVAVVTEDGVVVHADPLRLREAIRQLIDNALKFSPLDAPVTVRAVHEAGHGLVEIEDEGPGIPPERRAQVVERFPNWRPAGYEDRPGTGLGLFIAAGLLAGVRGEMAIGDGPHGGTMLRVRIPLER
jgi:signal transduction histidine kinase